MRLLYEYEYVLDCIRQVHRPLLVPVRRLRVGSQAVPLSHPRHHYFWRQHRGIYGYCPCMAPIHKRQNAPRASTKRAVSIAGLFKATKHKPSPKPASHNSQAHISDDLFRHSQKQKHPDHLRYLHVTERYRMGSRACQIGQLDAAHDELISYLEVSDSSGERRESEGIPGQARRNELNARTNMLFHPLAEDTMRLCTSDGQIEVLKFGQCMEVHQMRVQEKAAQVTAILHQLEQVDREISFTTDALVNDSDGAVKKMMVVRGARLAGIQQRLNAAKDVSLTEIVAAQKSEAENTKDFNTRLKGLIEELAYN
nr:hypothetical protein CFP56_52550 [Quercus suber]